MVGPLEKKGHARELVIRYLQSENYPNVTKAEQFLNTLNELVDMNFDPLDAFDALKETYNNDVEQACDMLFKIQESGYQRGQQVEVCDYRDWEIGTVEGWDRWGEPLVKIDGSSEKPRKFKNMRAMVAQPPPGPTHDRQRSNSLVEDDEAPAVLSPEEESRQIRELLQEKEDQSQPTLVTAAAQFRRRIFDIRAQRRLTSDPMELLPSATAALVHVLQDTEELQEAATPESDLLARVKQAQDMLKTAIASVRNCHGTEQEAAIERREHAQDQLLQEIDRACGKFDMQQVREAIGSAEAKAQILEMGVPGSLGKSGDPVVVVQTPGQFVLRAPNLGPICPGAGPSDGRSGRSRKERRGHHARRKERRERPRGNEERRVEGSCSVPDVARGLAVARSHSSNRKFREVGLASGPKRCREW